MEQTSYKLAISVLYVEDEQDIRENISRFLGRRVLNLFVGSDGREGLELFKENSIDIVITDIRMPIMNGLEMIKEIKTIDEDVMCVVTSAHSEADYFVKCIDLGVGGFLLKPVILEKLSDLLTKYERQMALKRDLKLQRERLRAILDFQDSIVVLTDGQQIVEANRSFLDFFGFKDIDEFHEKHSCITEFFIKGDGFFDASGCSCWMSEIQSSNLVGKIKVKMRNTDSQERVFIANVKPLPGDDKLHVASFADITELEKEARLLEKLATTDSLTGAFNRMKFDELFSGQIEMSKRYSMPLALIMLDIDHFKNVNDTMGHKCGDRVLIALSDLVRAHIRSIDIFSRWGGEEFMILAPNTNLTGATNMAENLRVAIESYRQPGLPCITCSLGVVEFIQNDTSSTMFSRVDKALYTAKEQGRNLVVQGVE